MTTNILLQQRRSHALDILQEGLPGDVYLPIDYVIDDECRQKLNLPPRPANASPYVGWMMMPDNPTTNIVSKISLAGLDLIKSFEGLRLSAYQCPAGIWTIGYGSTSGIKPGMSITHKQALGLLIKDVARFEQTVRTAVKVPLNQNQFDALVSFCYNVGSSAFQRSHLLATLNKGKYEDAAQELHRWVFAGKAKLPGLVRRREREYQLFIGKQG